MVKKMFVVLIFINLFFLQFPLYAAGVTINEVLVHPSSGNHEWVELYNPDKIDLSGYYIDDDTSFTDDSGSSPKKSLAEIQLSNTLYPYIDLNSSMFNNDGDSVILFDPTGTIVDQYVYTKDPGSDITLGRSPDGAGDFAILLSATRGSPNAVIQPTATLIPTKSTTATKAPTPTHTSTQIKVPTPTNITNMTNTPIIKIVNNADSIKVVPSGETIASLSVAPSTIVTSSSEAGVLAVEISPTPSKSFKPRILIKSANSLNILPLLLSSLGGICLIACGILTYKKIKHYE